MFDFTDIIKKSMPTKEEIEIMFQKRYLENLNTPENFSNWFPALKEAVDSTHTDYKYPESVYLTLPIDWIRWLKNDKYSPEKIAEFAEYLIQSFKLELGHTYFLKTGVFSNKFDFETAKVVDINNIGNQLLNMFYASMIVGADATNEVVIREYIEPVEELAHIYNGMPLRTEYRVFADLKGEDSEIIGVVNYWHPLEMRKIRTHMTNLWDMDRKKLEETLSTFKQVHNQKNKMSLDTEMDIINYLLAEEEMTAKFNANKESVAEKMLAIIKNIDVSKLSGEWSIDVMQNGNEFYVIDAARKENSALNEYL